MQRFYSYGKLLLTAEYVVLDGAKALAVPTKFGQTLTVENSIEQKLVWQSIDHQGDVWFEEEFILSNGHISASLTPRNDISKRLIAILNAAQSLNPEFLSAEIGFKVISTLEFPNNWGLGSSSTLLNNVARWAKVDAFALSKLTFGGSGYDIACAQNDSAIIYQLENTKPLIERISLNKNFEDELFFVHLNRKQDSRASIKTYNSNKTNSSAIISNINTITDEIVKSNSIESFNSLIEKHEELIGETTNQIPIKKRLFNDFNNQIKSLGGWNGDFVLATGNKDYITQYFSSKGYKTIVGYKDMIL